MTKETFDLRKAVLARGKQKAIPSKLIFLMGFKNTGKDIFAQDLIDISTNPMVRVAFADALKKEYYPKLGVEYTDPVTECREFKDNNRAGIISYGEGMKQENGMYHWVEKALYPVFEANMKKGKPDDIIVTDCRRIEEVMWFESFKNGSFRDDKFVDQMRRLYDPVMYVVHRKDAEKEDSDYLTNIALLYQAKMMVSRRLVRNYKDLKDLKRQARDIYAADIR